MELLLVRPPRRIGGKVWSILMPIRDDEREDSGHSAARRHEPVLVEPEAGSEASLVPGAPERGTDFRRFALTWAVPLGLVIVATASSVYLRGSPSAAVPACAAADWHTELTLDRSRPELATTTLRSRNAVGPQGRADCAEVSFGCRPDGPLFRAALEFADAADATNWPDRGAQ